MATERIGSRESPGLYSLNADRPLPPRLLGLEPTLIFRTRRFDGWMIIDNNNRLISQHFSRCGPFARPLSKLLRQNCVPLNPRISIIPLRLCGKFLCGRLVSPTESSIHLARKEEPPRARIDEHRQPVVSRKRKPFFLPAPSLPPRRETGRGGRNRTAAPLRRVSEPARFRVSAEQAIVGSVSLADRGKSPPLNGGPKGKGKAIFIVHDGGLKSPEWNAACG